MTERVLNCICCLQQNLCLKIETRIHTRVIVCVCVCNDDDDDDQVTDISLVPVEVLFRTLRIKRFFFFLPRFLWFCFFVVEIHCKQVEWDPSREALDRSHWIDDRERRGCWFASILFVEINALSDIEEREREEGTW